MILTRVRTYTNGLIQSDSYIANGLTINNVPNKLVCINLGLTALSALTAPQVTGDFPIITSGITGMIIDFYDAVTTIRYNVEVSTCCGSGKKKTTLYYVNSKGVFEHVNFCTKSKKRFAKRFKQHIDQLNNTLKQVTEIVVAVW